MDRSGIERIEAKSLSQNILTSVTMEIYHQISAHGTESILPKGFYPELCGDRHLEDFRDSSWVGKKDSRVHGQLVVSSRLP